MVDVVLVVVVVIMVVEFVLCGFGGDVFVFVWDGEWLFGLNVLGVVLVVWNVDYFCKCYGEDVYGIVNKLMCGWDIVMVLGVIVGWEVLYVKFGLLLFVDLFELVIEIVECGYLVLLIVVYKWVVVVFEL